MITLKDVHKSFGSQTLFDGASLQINQGDRFALVGPNGAGKSTLFKMLLGETEPDSGEIQWRRNVQTGYLPQENAPVTDRPVLEEALAHHPDPDGRVEAKAKSILAGLGFKQSDFTRPLNTLSGGWSMRVAMARLLIQEPDLLMLDEPTNHLDLDSLFWFQDYLTQYPGAIFLISHDRAFINAICQAIISVQNHTLKTYHGDYEHYLSERQAERERIEQAYRQQQEEIADMQDFISRNRARASTASRAQSMIKRLEKLERVEVPEETKVLKIKFPQPDRTGVRVLSLKNIHKSYGEVKVYQGLDFELERGQKMAFVGHNGAGKSTLLKMLAGVIPYDSGERVLGLNVKVGYFAQHHAGLLDPQKTVLQEAQNNGRDNTEQMVRSVLGSFLFPGNSVFKKVGVLSGGEKSRLALVKLLLDPPNVLLMDEPTTHLDMASVDALIQALKDFEGTACFISHDLYFINQLADHVVHVEGGKITIYPGNYEYFLHRQRQKPAEENSTEAPFTPVQPKAQQPVEPTIPETSGGGSHRDQRREERKQRQQERLKAQEIERIQSEIEDVKSRVEKLTLQLQDPEIYKDFLLVKSLTDEIKEKQARIGALEEKVSGQG